jgi:hypothetical protein
MKIAYNDEGKPMKIPDHTCPHCKWHIIWFVRTETGVQGSCYDCGTWFTWTAATNKVTEGRGDSDPDALDV